MQRLRLSALVLVGLTACAVPRETDEGETPWVALFNGRDLSGWVPKIRGYPLGENYADTFRVVDGLLRVDYSGYADGFGERFGHLFYEAPFEHYRLRVEYRFVGEQVPGGAGWAWRNSGVMLHGQSPETMELDQEFPVSIEVQFLGGNGVDPRPTANLCTPGTHVVLDGSLEKRHCINSTSGTQHGDGWVTVEVEVHGDERITHFVGGVPVLTYTQPQLDPDDADAQRLIGEGGVRLSGGSISLQSESHSIEFRRVELLPLDPFPQGS